MTNNTSTLTPDVARAYRSILRFAELNRDGSGARELVLRSLDALDGTGTLPNSSGVRELVERGFLQQLSTRTYRLAIPNPDAEASDDDTEVPEPLRTGDERSGISGDRHPIEKIEARRPLRVKGKRRVAA
ncbi:hypothetical protein [Isoptericola sediminis]|uniref:Uncharacterized protein n=1 Tax=Isoptericola sediminis TaxID=2733572 RepID=A0A849K383_9MICO|nr:hypothetical protein [Isoptericola sediminis]NNU26790.1 hypothetical protein [Isoptericola sediminis]